MSNINVNKAAEILNISASQVRRLICLRKIKAEKLGTYYAIDLDALLRFKEKYENIISIEKAAEMLNLSNYKVRRLVETKALKSRKVCGKTSIQMDSIEEYKNSKSGDL